MRLSRSGTLCSLRWGSAGHKLDFWCKPEQPGWNVTLQLRLGGRKDKPMRSLPFNHQQNMFIWMVDVRQEGGQADDKRKHQASWNHVSWPLWLDKGQDGLIWARSHQELALDPGWVQPWKWHFHCSREREGIAVCLVHVLRKSGVWSVVES